MDFIRFAHEGGSQVSGFRFQVSGFRFQVSGNAKFKRMHYQLFSSPEMQRPHQFVFGFPDTSDLRPALWLLWQREAGSVNLFKYRISAAVKESLADLIAQLRRIVAFADFSQDFRS